MNKELKTNILDSIINHWYTEEMEGGIKLFYKHVSANKKNKIYQIILSSTEYDGVYELCITNKQFRGFIENDIIHISKKGNLDFALFKPKEKGVYPQGYLNPSYCAVYGYSVVRCDYKDEESFKEALMETGLVTDEEYEIYTSSITRDYVYDKTPKIKFI